ncbi:hypothetical protein [Arthrobacter oryzae]|uniref:Uncharacterized protein n=1 Tax=Arthrobacter oryzae TaxID=409290 RepID=A0A495E6X5_9MICC|nr:hypothetical protein [Arthrobacter oryzae]RKR12670.1 hypothetical protein C8D78_3777 [Arthrobacter oryzae]
MRRLRPIGPAVSAGFLVAALLGACGAPAATGPGTGTGAGPDTATAAVPTVPPLTSAPAGSGGGDVPTPAGTGLSDVPTPSSSGGADAPMTESPPAPVTSMPRAVNWQTLKTPDGKLQFDHPAEWTVKDRGAEAANGGVFLEVLNPGGKSLATLRTNVATGAECRQRIPYSVLELDPVPALEQQGVIPHFIFELRLYAAETDPTKANIMAYGISSAPKPSGRDACPIFQFFTWPPGGASFGGVYNPFDTTPGNQPHVDTPEAYLETAEYQDIKKMITSLRPVGQ